MLPITYLSPQVTYRANQLYKRVDRAKQVKPYNLPARYWKVEMVTTRAEATGTFTLANSDPGSYRSSPEGGGHPCCPDPFTVPTVEDARATSENRLYAKMVNQVKSAENMFLVSWAERQQSLRMITSRLLELNSIARDLRRGRIPRSIRLPPGWRSRARGFANQWLEIWFGWVPLIHDIHGALTIFEKDPSRGRLKVRSGAPFARTEERSTGGSYQRLDYRGVVISTYSCDVVPVDWDVVLLEKAGVLNPLSFAWELVPFSFVVDWFVNVGDVLSSLSDTAGYRFENASYSHFCKVSQSYLRTNLPPWNVTYPGSESSSHEGFAIRRTVGELPRPTLKVRPLRPLSLARGLTASSLLLQSLRG